MQLSEKEIEDFIFDDLKENQGGGLYRRGLGTIISMVGLEGDYPKATWLRQVNLGEYGILDIVGFYRYNGKLIIELFELKAVAIESSHFDQILRYQTGIKKYLQRERPGLRFNIVPYLIGRGYNSGHYIQNNIYNLKVSEVSYDLCGLGFDTHGNDWHRTADKNFNFIANVRRMIHA